MSVGRPKVFLTKEKIAKALVDSDYVLSTAAEICEVSFTTFKREFSRYFTDDMFEKGDEIYTLSFLDDVIEKKKKTVFIPKLNKITIQTDKKSVLICPVGDIHYGHRDCDEETLKFVLEWLYKEKDVYVFSMADLVEASVIDSPGLFDQVDFLDTQFYDVVKMFKPLADEGRLLGMHTGNHENRVKKKTGLDITKVMCRMLNTKYFGEGMLHLIKVTNGKDSQTYTMYSTHGASSARFPQTKMLACMRLDRIADAEIYCMGHVHSLAHDKMDRYVIENGKVIKKPRHYILTGSYLQYWGSYAQAKGMLPSGDTGSPKIKLHVDTHRISVSF